MNKYEKMSNEELRIAVNNGRIGVGSWRDSASREDMIVALVADELEAAYAYDAVGHPAADAIAEAIRGSLRLIPDAVHAR